MAAVFFAAPFCCVMPVVTVKTMPELTVKAAVFEFALLNVNEFTVAFVVTVTEAPATITAASALAGTTPPDHVVVAFQFPPVAVVVLVAPRALDVPNKPSRSANNVKYFTFFTFLWTTCSSLG